MLKDMRKRTPETTSFNYVKLFIEHEGKVSNSEFDQDISSGRTDAMNRLFLISSLHLSRRCYHSRHEYDMWLFLISSLHLSRRCYHSRHECDMWLFLISSLHLSRRCYHSRHECDMWIKTEGSWRTWETTGGTGATKIESIMWLQSRPNGGVQWTLDTGCLSVKNIRY